jgi:hypothetical protein
MAVQQLVISAFVASPSDVGEERAILEEIVAELNLTWSRTLQLRIELVRWETHVTPGIGGYPQQVINRQIGDEYDIFIGILWARFGSPTAEALSGTAEEFERALARYRQNPDAVDIMFYFKDAPVIPSQLDLSQLGKVRSFKEGLGDEGVLHWSFGPREQFIQLLRLHLSRVVQRWEQKSESSSVQKALTTRVPPDPNGQEDADADDLGFLDHIEEGNLAFQRGTESLNRIASATDDVGTAMQARTADMGNLTNVNGQYDVQGAKKVAKATAQDLNDFAARMEVEIPIFSDSYQRALGHIIAAANLSVEDFTPELEQLASVRDMVSDNLRAITGATDNVLSFRQIISNLPRIQSAFNKAKRRTIKVLDDQVDKLEFSKRLSFECVQLLDELIGRVRRQSGKQK